MRNTRKLFGAVGSIAIITFFMGIAFVFTSCDNGTAGNTYESLILKGKDVRGDDVDVEFSTNRTISRAVMTMANGDAYAIRLNGRLISHGYLEISYHPYIIFKSLAGERFYASYISGIMTLTAVPDMNGGFVTGIIVTSPGTVFMPTPPPSSPSFPVDDDDDDDDDTDPVTDPGTDPGTDPDPDPGSDPNG